jgi:hypothetical protein
MMDFATLASYVARLVEISKWMVVCAGEKTKKRKEVATFTLRGIKVGSRIYTTSIFDVFVSLNV